MKMALQIRSKFVLLLGDLALLLLALALATDLRLGSPWFIPEEYGVATVLCALLFPFALFLARAYEVHPQASLAEHLRRPFFGVALAGLATSFFFYFAPGYRFGRGIYVLMIVIYVLLLGLWRTVVFVQVRGRKLSVLVMGEPAHVQTACKVLKEFSPSTDIRVWPQGAPENGGEAAPEPNGGGPRQGDQQPGGGGADPPRGLAPTRPAGSHGPAPPPRQGPADSASAGPMLASGAMEGPEPARPAHPYNGDSNGSSLRRGGGVVAAEGGGDHMGLSYPDVMNTRR